MGESCKKLTNFRFGLRQGLDEFTLFYFSTFWDEFSLFLLFCLLVMSSFPYFSAFFLPIPNQSQFIVPTFSTFPTFPNHTMSSHFQNFQKFHFLNQQLMLFLPFNELPFPHSFSYLSMSFHSHSFSYFSYLSMSSHSHSFSYFSYLSLSTHSPIYFPTFSTF